MMKLMMINKKNQKYISLKCALSTTSENDQIAMVYIQSTRFHSGHNLSVCAKAVSLRIIHDTHDLALQSGYYYKKVVK